jgi:type IV secretory pathway TrbD component
LFPWPRGPGMAEVLSRINDVDLFIYTYLIKTWMLAGLSVLAWVITVLFVYKATKHDFVLRVAKN